MELTFWYYIRDPKNTPLITVVVLYDIINNEYARGVSICGPKDNPNREEGRWWARSFAEEALKEKSNLVEVSRPEALYVLDSIENVPEFDMYKWKSWYLPELTNKELSLFEKANNKLNKFIQGDE